MFHVMSMINKPKSAGEGFQSAAKPATSSTASLGALSFGKELDEKIMTPQVKPGDVSGGVGQGTELRGGAAAEQRRQPLAKRADRYLADLIEEVGEPSDEAIAEAKAFWDRIESSRAARASE